MFCGGKALRTAMLCLTPRRPNFEKDFILDSDHASMKQESFFRILGRFRETARTLRCYQLRRHHFEVFNFCGVAMIGCSKIPWLRSSVVLFAVPRWPQQLFCRSYLLTEVDFSWPSPWSQGCQALNYCRDLLHCQWYLLICEVGLFNRWSFLASTFGISALHLARDSHRCMLYGRCRHW